MLGLAGLYLVSSVVAHTVLWLAFGTDKSTDKTQEFWLLQNSALTALRFSLFFVHQQPSLLSSQRNWIFQVLAVQVYVSAMSVAWVPSKALFFLCVDLCSKLG